MVSLLPLGQSSTSGWVSDLQGAMTCNGPSSDQFCHSNEKYLDLFFVGRFMRTSI